MQRASPTIPAAKTARALNIGSVSYLNARPLIYGLDDARDVGLHLDVPSRLLDGLREHRFDVALLPVIDYQRMPGLRMLTAGGIGCDGPTLTVRIFSCTPIQSIRSLACDTDSHTSVALARIVLAELYQCRPRFLDLTRSDDSEGEARLLIGDKVVCEEPLMEHQLDLGAAWKELTGLPFVFAAWMTRDGIDLDDLPARLEVAKHEGLKHVDEIITRYAVPRGWPAGVALQYLTLYLKYGIGAPQLDAIRLFHQLASKHGFTPEFPRALEFYDG